MPEAVYSDISVLREHIPFCRNSVTFDLCFRRKQWIFGNGVQNMAGKNPPFVLNAAWNSADNTYGGFYLGRYIFLQAGLSF